MLDEAHPRPDFSCREGSSADFRILVPHEARFLPDTIALFSLFSSSTLFSLHPDDSSKKRALHFCLLATVSLRIPWENDVQESFNEHYRSGNTPWDSGISPPELIEAVTGPTALAPGRMLDIGCGTGTNCLTLARLGWQTVGVDFVSLAIERANQKAAAVEDEIARAGGSVCFTQADVTRLAAPDERFSLLLDLGCLNGIPPDLRDRYAEMVVQQAMPGALFLLYAHFPNADRNRPPGCTPEEIDRLFTPGLRLERRVSGVAPQGGRSMWNWLRRSS